MVASREWASAAVSPMPLSSMVTRPPDAESRMRTCAAGSRAWRAVIASTAFCRSSRT